MTKRPDLPGVLSEIAAEIGEDVAIKLARARGGRELMVPKSAEGTVLADIVGIEAAAAIIKLLGHGRFVVPAGAYSGQGARRAAAEQMLREGASLAEVAQTCGVDKSTAFRYRQSLGRIVDKRQSELPFDS
ncbi:MAG: hypothetical protein AAF401_12995 [Pseudomonadota bacterium]